MSQPGEAGLHALNKGGGNALHDFMLPTAEVQPLTAECKLPGGMKSKQCELPKKTVLHGVARGLRLM